MLNCAPLIPRQTHLFKDHPTAMALDIKQIDKPIRKLRKLLKKMSADPSPKQVHDLRTNSRRLEATLQATNPNSNDRKAQKQVAQLRKRAGKIRDMDVLTAYAMELPHEGDEEDCSVRLLEHLGAVRQEKAKKLYKAMQETSSGLRKRLKRSSKSVTQPDPAISSQITSTALELLSELDEPAHLNKSNLHPYRLKVKELQNLLRLAANSKNETFVAALGEVKDKIGEWHDWVELQSIAQDVSQHPHCRLLQELKSKTGKRYAQALHLTQVMRKKYLGKLDRRQLGKRKPPHAAGLVWSATAALTG
jgi:CHAD domain-containing protein